jgi:hypothetical protein
MQGIMPAVEAIGARLPDQFNEHINRALARRPVPISADRPEPLILLLLGHRLGLPHRREQPVSVNLDLATFRL